MTILTFPSTLFIYIIELDVKCTNTYVCLPEMKGKYGSRRRQNRPSGWKNRSASRSRTRACRLLDRRDGKSRRSAGSTAGDIGTTARGSEYPDRADEDPDRRQEKPPGASAQAVERLEDPPGVRDQRAGAREVRRGGGMERVGPE